MSKLKKYSLLALSLVTAILLFSALFLPSLIRSKAAEAINTKYHRTLVIDKISINPLTGNVEARGISLSEQKSSALFFTCSSVRMKISPVSLYHRAPVLSAIDVVSPYIHLIRNDATSYNFSDLIPPPKAEADDSPARFSLNNIRLLGGAVDITDKLIHAKQNQAVRNLEIRIPFLSNLPYLAETYITPGMSATVDGARFALEGKIKPFAKHVEVIVKVKLDKLDLPQLAAYLPATIPIKLLSGAVTTDLQINHRAVATGLPALIVSGTARVDNLELTDRQDHHLFSLEKGSVNIRQARILAGIYDIDTIELSKPTVHLSRDQRGMINVMELVAPPATALEVPRPAQEKLKESISKGMKQHKTDAVLVTIGKINVHKGEIHFSDRLPTGGFAVDLNAINLDIQGLSTQTDKQAKYTLNVTSNRNERLDLSGTFSVKPAATVTKAVFSSLTLDALNPYFTNTLTSPVSGMLDGSASVSFSPLDGIRVADLALTLKKLALRYGVKDGITLPEITLKGGTIDSKDHQATVESISVTGGNVIVSRAADGKLSPMSLLRQTGATVAPPQASSPLNSTPAQAPDKPFRYVIKSTRVSGLDLDFTDYQNKSAPTLNFKRSALSLENVTGPVSSSMPFRFATEFGGGALTSAGNFTFAPFTFSGTCMLKGLRLTAFDSYFPSELHLIVADGILDTNLSLSLATATAGLKGSYQGDITVKRFYSLDDTEGEDLLKWDNLHLGGITGTINPFSLNLAQVALSDYFAQVTIEKDSTLNLQKLYGPGPNQAAGPGVAVQKSPQTASPPATAPGKVAIEAVTLQGGTVEFRDQHVKPEFTATMYQLGGKINGLSSEQTKLADVELRGNLRNQSPLGITGTINPLRGDLFLDMKVSFSDIELAPMSPYSGSYLGYTVDKGKLYLDLIYHIEHQLLTSENKVFIDQFSFGDKVESDKATRLPVRLAIALLKDRKGEIHLDLPVTGRTDDPQFSIWKVVGQILMNLLEKAATSPFKLLGSLVGGGESFSSVVFAPGSAELTEGEQHKLSKLGKLLLDRPALHLEVSGYVDPERDPEGYRQELLRKKMRNEKFLALVKEGKNLPGQTADEMIIGPEEYSAWLKAVYSKDKFPKPRNALGLEKELPDEEMKKLIFANTAAGSEELAQLSRWRVDTVKIYLVSKAGVPRERLFESGGKQSAHHHEAGIHSGRVEFGLATK